MNNEEKIKYLSEDAAFGILTRPALELTMSEANGDAILYIIDFDDIHKMNMNLGYDKVNTLIRASVADLNQNFARLIIGRVFSGDEIAIVGSDDYHVCLVSNYADVCKTYDLGFRWVDMKITLGDSHTLHSIQLNRLSKKLQTSRYAKML